MKRSRVLYPMMVITAIVSGLTFPALSRPSCNPVHVASLDMQFHNIGGVSVPVSLAGQRVDLLIDTGGSGSLLTESTANALSLEATEIVGRHDMIFGGIHIDRFVTAHNVDLGGIKMAQKDFQLLPDGHLPYGLGGTLAPDILRAYDVEFDFANGKLNLFSPTLCPGSPVHWTKQPHVELPFKLDNVGHILLNLKLDGKDVSVSLDTGSSRSILGLESAEAAFGFDDRSPLLRLVARTGLGQVYQYPFHVLLLGDSLSGVGSISIVNPDLFLISRADSGMLYGPELILGMGILRNIHLYIDYKQQKIYATPVSLE